MNRQGGNRKWLGYRAGSLHVEDVCLSAVAHAVPTPFYCYSADAIRSTYAHLAAAVHPIGASICFAVKANSNISVLRLLSDLGCGMDIVSGGELERALAAGVPASKIIFSGVGKTRAEIARAIEAGIHQINVESPAEITAVAEVARSSASAHPSRSASIPISMPRHTQRSRQPRKKASSASRSVMWRTSTPKPLRGLSWNWLASPFTSDRRSRI